MRIIRSVRAWRRLKRGGAFRGKDIGFVPTMGALHEGHLSLIRRAKKENDLAVASIFVNPTQFNDKKDLQRYPRTLADDAKKLALAGTDLLFLPDYRGMYPDDYRYRVSENSESRLLCGAFRPGHFDGVLTVVMKLLNIIGANRAYFGEKDYQQYVLIQGMAEAFFLDTEIIPCRIVREADGLAMSSRNALLNPAERALAPEFRRTLSAPGSTDAIKKKLAAAGLRPEYVEERWGRRLAAVKIGKIRLIDNIRIRRA